LNREIEEEGEEEEGGIFAQEKDAVELRDHERMESNLVGSLHSDTSSEEEDDEKEEMLRRGGRISGQESKTPKEWEEERERHPPSGRAKRWASFKDKQSKEGVHKDHYPRVVALLCLAEDCWQMTPTRRGWLALLTATLLGMVVGAQVGKNWVGPAEKVVVLHCPAGGAEGEDTNVHGNFWAGPPAVRESRTYPEEAAQTWWSAMRKISPAFADASEDFVDFTKDYYNCKRLRRSHDYVDHEWQTLLNFGAAAQTQGRWSRPGDQPSILVGASQSGSILLSAAGLVGAVASGVKIFWKAVRS